MLTGADANPELVCVLAGALVALVSDKNRFLYEDEELYKPPDPASLSGLGLCARTGRVEWWV